MAAVRTRFAPSPTGFLHLGSARTALFNWAFARRHGGSLVLRIEDTDLLRSTRESEAALVEGLAWLGIDWDEGPFRQSERRGRHDAAVEDLIAKGHAYRCTCTREELEARKQEVIAAGGKWTYDGRCRDAGHGPRAAAHAVRLRLPTEGRYRFDDLVFGPSGQDVREMGDRIIRRSDGAPLFHLAVVVDDVDMGITHVIRGADHHINTPFQLALYEAIGARPPAFAHVPLIVAEGGKKLSKRREAVAIEHFRGEGFLPEALCNWIVRLGWSHGDQEIFSRDEIARHFDLASVHRAPAQADTAKLLHLNQHWIKALPMDALFGRLAPFLEAQAGGPVARTPELERLVDLLRERSRTLAELAERARFALVEEIAWEETAARKFLRSEAAAPLSDLHERLAELPEWSEPALEAAFRSVCAAHGGLGLGKLAQPVRVAVTGTSASPGIFETLAVLGRERSLRRIAEALHAARHGG
jgi:glutamyl-tRNA synthetase